MTYELFKIDCKLFEPNQASAFPKLQLKIICIFTNFLEFSAVVVYGGRPDAPTGSLYDNLFDEGVRMGSWGLLLHSITGTSI